MAIVPVPTTRVGDYFTRQRLVSQVQADQLALFQLQNQVSTGRRILRPSDDAAAALRAMNVQRVLLRKDQVQTNLTNSKAVLGAADASLATVSNQLSDIRAAALGVADTISTDSDRQAVIHLVDSALESLVATANTNFKGRYLFAGSRTDTLPFDFQGQFVEYLGNEKGLQNFVDLGQLFTTNVPGTEVFGGRSGEVRGTADLDPQLTVGTLLSSINGGAGLGANAAISLSITEPSGTTTKVVDLSGAVTVGDVMRIIEENSPLADVDVTVDFEANGLSIRSETGTIRIGEVASGRSARELGIFTPSSMPLSNTVTGTDLDPIVRKTTLLADLLGRKATGRIVSAGASNDLILTANQNGASFNGVDVVFVNDVTAGNESATFAAGVLTVHIQAGVTTANQVAEAINAEGTFTALPDYRDAATVSAAGAAPVYDGTFTAVTADGAGTALDLADGIVLTNGTETVALDLSTAETVEDLLNLINGAGVGLIGAINAAGTGIDVRSVWSGADFTIGESGGVTASQLGIRTFTGATPLASLNRGVGVPTSDAGDDLQIVARDGMTFSVDLTGATTVQHVLDRINAAATTAGVNVTARLATIGNGIELVDATVGAGALAVSEVPGSQAAEYLGFVPNGAVIVDGGGNQVLTSQDRNTLEVDSVFNSLIRLRTALSSADIPEIGRAIERLDTDLTRVNFARAEIGSRLQGLDVIQTRLEDENVQLQTALSNDLDVDLVEAISNLTAKQYALQASLKTAANILNLSLLDYI